MREAAGLSRRALDGKLGALGKTSSSAYVAQLETGRFLPPDQQTCEIIEDAIGASYRGRLWDAAAPEKLHAEGLYEWHQEYLGLATRAAARADELTGSLWKAIDELAATYVDGIPEQLGQGPRPGPDGVEALRYPADRRGAYLVPEDVMRALLECIETVNAMKDEDPAASADFYGLFARVRRLHPAVQARLWRRFSRLAGDTEIDLVMFEEYRASGWRPHAEASRPAPPVWRPLPTGNDLLDRMLGVDGDGDDEPPF